MSDKNTGLFKKYEVVKLSNPGKEIDAIVLEFDDPIARVGIEAWRAEMAKNGYIECSNDVGERLHRYGHVSKISHFDYERQVSPLEKENTELKSELDKRDARIEKLEEFKEKILHAYRGHDICAMAHWIKATLDKELTQGE